MHFHLDSDFCLHQHVISSKLILVPWSHCQNPICSGAVKDMRVYWLLNGTCHVHLFEMWLIWPLFAPQTISILCGASGSVSSLEMKNSGGPKQKNKSCVNSILIWSMSTWQFIPLEQMSFSWEQPSESMRTACPLCRRIDNISWHMSGLSCCGTFCR